MDSLEHRKQKVLGTLNVRTGRNFRTFPRGLTKTLSQFTDEEIDLALSEMVEDPWHKKILQSSKPFSPDYMLRDTVIDKWLQAALARPRATVNELNQEPLVEI